MDKLPLLVPEDLNPTRDYVQGVAHALGSLQRMFVPKQPRDWQYGLEVYMRGISTQELPVGIQQKRVLLDLHTGKVRLDDIAWKLDEFDGPEILKNLKVWLASNNISPQFEVEEPPFVAGRYDEAQAKAYFEALWWFDRQFKIVKAGLADGVTSPVLLYAHHFDLALNWFPWDDDRQVSVGWSTGDETIAEPYVYWTAYPEPKGFSGLPLHGGAYWNNKDFSGAIFPYAALQKSAEPDKILQSLNAEIFTHGRKLLNK